MPTKDRTSRAAETFNILKQHYPDADCALKHENPWQLLAATILSAQCTDARVNMVTPHLFARYPTPQAMASAVPEELEAVVRSTGFFRQKAKSLISMSQDVVARFAGEVPQTLEELTTLRGVGRKTANVMIGVAFGGQGLVVDTHVKRLSKRLGWTKNTDPYKVEQDLMKRFPRSEWTAIAHTLILHGRAICDARKPKCGDCPVNQLCPEGKARLAGRAPATG
jgi:endonuclease III